VRLIAPPVAEVLSPALMDTRPAEPEVPAPIRTLMLPPVPLFADPVLIRRDPLLPELVVPVPKNSAPLTPAAPASEVRRLNVPLLLL